MTMPRSEGLPAVAKLREVFSYEPETGILRRKIMGYVRNKPVGSLIRGYLTASVDNKRIYVHRLVWAMHYGQWPDSILDHINGDPGDNRIENLRLATKAQNGQNRGRASHNTSGFKGVYWNRKNKKWFSVSVVEKQRKYLGSYDTPEEASEAYQAFIRLKAGEFARTE